jgi:HSP20 family protein
MTNVAHRHTTIADLRTRLASNSPFRFRGSLLASHVRIEDYIEDDTYVLRAELPGIDPDRDVDVTLEGDLLTIDGERREEIRDKHRHELYYGSFCRTVALPSGARPEKVTAAYTDGVLEIQVPLRSEGATKPTRIPVLH